MRAVYVIDDDPAIRVLIPALVGEYFRVVALPDGGREPASFDVALIDINLANGINGFHVASQLRHKAPLVFTSGIEDPQIYRLAGHSGYGFIQKPVTKFQLLGTLECALNRSGDLKRAEQSRFIDSTSGNIAGMNRVQPPEQSARFLKEAKERGMTILELMEEKYKALQELNSTLV